MAEKDCFIKGSLLGGPQTPEPGSSEIAVPRWGPSGRRVDLVGNLGIQAGP